MLLSMPKGHLVVRCLDNDFIVDTGSPLSFNYLGFPALEIDGREYPFGSAVCPRETLEELTGRSIAGIIGMDVLRQTGLTVDMENMALDFSYVPCPDQTEISFGLFMGSYLVTDDVVLGRQLRNAIIDTGAPVPYISSRLTGLLAPTGETYEDLSPTYGVLRGEYLQGGLSLRTDALGRVRQVKVGLMPQIVDLFGLFDAILGVTALSDKRVAFDFRNSLIGVRL